ncbi:MAG: response regulator [Alphaproteobacteria bacterium]|nr:response regulator [Alphaproteobacteria bacterium]
MAHVLIVEDSSTQAEKLSFILEQAGLQPRIAVDGESALETLQGAPVDLVISDIVMPGICGYELCRRIKSDSALKSTPVMLLSTLNEPMDIIRGLECGADNFLTKPYEPDQLVTRVRHVLENRTLRGGGRVTLGIEIVFLGRRFTITAERQQILDLLISTFEDAVRANRELEKSRSELAKAKNAVEQYAATLEEKVRERTDDLRETNRALHAEIAVREQTEQELLRTRKFLSLVIENLPGVVFVKNGADRRYTLLNRAGEELLGCPRDWVIGKTDDELFEPDEAKQFADCDERALRSGEPIVCPEQTATPRGRTRRLLRTTRIPVFEEGGESPFLVGFAEDITERKELEHRLLHTQKLDAVGKLTGGIAHDFNNLLGIIIGSLDLLAERLENDEEACELAQEGLRSAERGAELTRRMLAFARQQPLQTRLVDLNKIVTDMVPLLRRTLGENITVSAMLADALWWAHSDSGQIENALLNLAVNARDAMPDGGTLLIETGKISLDEDYVARTAEVSAGDYVMLAVTDSGSGMSSDTVQRAFDPFFTTKEPGRGTGLGLSMVYGFAKQSGGHVKIYSELGRGTTVKLYLPRSEPVRASASETRTRSALPRGNGETVLLVEDDAQLRNVALRMLSELGYQAIAAQDARSALECIEQAGSVDLLFTDLVLPEGLDGHQLAEQARQANPQLKVLFTSGYSKEFVRRAHWNDSDHELLVKPYRKQELAEKIRCVLENAVEREPAE